MTEQKAIEYLKFIKNGLHPNGHNDQCIDMAIEALENQIKVKEILSTPTLFAEKFDRIREVEKIMLN